MTIAWNRVAAWLMAAAMLPVGALICEAGAAGAETIATTVSSQSGAVEASPGVVAAAGSLIDPVNLPPDEEKLAEETWHHFAYKEENAIFSPKYLGGSADPSKTPELDWYFPYFIEFCKEKDLLSYKTLETGKGVYKQIMEDFSDYYRKNSIYWPIQKDINDDWNAYIPENQTSITFFKDGGVWKAYLGEHDRHVSVEDYVKSAEIVQELAPIGDDPFAPYRYPEEATAESPTEPDVENPRNQNHSARHTNSSALPVVGGTVGGAIIGIIVGRLTKRQ